MISDNHFFTRKNIINLLLLAITVLGLPLGLNALKTAQILRSRASLDPIVFTGPNVETRNSKTVATKPQVSVQIASPLGPPGGSVGIGSTAAITAYKRIDDLQLNKFLVIHQITTQNLTYLLSPTLALATAPDCVCPNGGTMNWTCRSDQNKASCTEACAGATLCPCKNGSSDSGCSTGGDNGGSGRTTTPPADTTPPTITAFSVSTDSTTKRAVLSWSASDASGIQKTDVYRATDQNGTDRNDWVLAGTVTGNASSFTDNASGLADGVYWYGVHVADNSAAHNCRTESGQSCTNGTISGSTISTYPGIKRFVLNTAPPTPDCDSTPVCTGTCILNTNAPANTCANNGTQINCQYSARSDGRSCNRVGVRDQNGLPNITCNVTTNCNPGYSCNTGSCTADPCPRTAQSCTTSSGQLSTYYCTATTCRDDAQAGCWNTPATGGTAGSKVNSCVLPSELVCGSVSVDNLSASGTDIEGRVIYTPSQSGSRSSNLTVNFNFPETLSPQPGVNKTVINQPSARKLVAGTDTTAPTSVPDPTIRRNVNNSGNWVITIPDNDTSTDVDYIPTVTVTRRTNNSSGNAVDTNATCQESFRIRVPKRTVVADRTCPYVASNGSTQVRFRPTGSSGPWTTNNNDSPLTVGQSIDVKGFHNNSVTTATDMTVSVTGPAGPSSITVDIDPNNPAFTPPSAGSYTVNGSVRDKNQDSACVGVASLTVQAATTVSCSGLSAQGLTDTGNVNDQGQRIYSTVDYKGGNKALTANRGPQNASVNQPTVTKVTSSAPDLAVSADTGGVSDSGWILNIPQNNSTTLDNDYRVSAAIAANSQNRTCPAFILRVPKKPVDNSCPYDRLSDGSQGSTEAWFKLPNSSEWIRGNEAHPVYVGQTIRVGGFHNNRIDTLADDTSLSAVGPQGSNAQTVDLNNPNDQDPARRNNVNFTPTKSGTYTLNSRVVGKDGNRCSGAATLTVQEVPVTTVSFKFAADPVSLATASAIPYTQEPVTQNIDFTKLLNDPDPRGVKTLFVEFTDSKGKKEVRQQSIELVGPDPTLTALSCDINLGHTGVGLKLAGKEFGKDQGKGNIEVNGSQVGVLEWKDNSVAALVNNIPTDSNQTFRVTVTRDDGQKSTNTCKLGVTQIALSTKLFCRNPSSRTQDNIQVTLLENTPNGQKVSEKVSVDKDGIIQGLKSKLQIGKEYKIALKAPKSIRKVATFTASDGTNSIPDFVLPVGDIFPLDGGDGVINAADFGELKREYRASSTSTIVKVADLNQDGFVNSLDWSCMKSNYGQSSDPDPAPDKPALAPAPVPGIGTTNPSGIGSTSPAGIGATSGL